MNTKGQASLEAILSVTAVVLVLVIFTGTISEKMSEIPFETPENELEKLDKKVRNSQLKAFPNRVHSNKTMKERRWFR